MAVTRYCTSCGLDRRTGDRFCRNCGTPFPAGGMEPPDTVDLRIEGEPTAPGRPTTTFPPAPEVATAAPIPPSAVSPAPAAPARSVAVHVVALVGGAAILAALFLPWISSGTGSASAFDLGVQTLWSLDYAARPIRVGTVLFVLGGVGGGLAFVPGTVAVRRACGGLALVAAVAFVAQVVRAIDRVGGGPGDVVDAIGVGVYVTIAGAVALLVSR